MKKKSRAPIKSQNPITIATDLIPVATPKKNNDKNGKIKEKASSNGVDHDELDNRELLRALSEVKNGNFSVRMPVDQLGIAGKICDTLNDIISLNETLVEELTLARN